MKWTANRSDRPLVMSIIGIRPDIVRLSFVINKLDNNPDLDHIIVHTGQHYEEKLSGVFFQELKVRLPDFNLNIGAPGREHYQQHADLIPKIIDLCRSVKPDLIVFLGDSNSVLASIDLKKDGFKICHIESNMRSYDDRMPEEINRMAIDRVSDLLLTYHANYKMKGLIENLDRTKIKVVGNTIVEPALEMKKQLRLPSEKSHILVDIHRQENICSKERLEKILSFVEYFGNHSFYGSVKDKWMEKFPVKILSFGRTKQNIENFGLKLPKGVEWTPLMGYKDFLQAQIDSHYIISDSGTAQEETALLDVPVFVPRDFTERPESYDARCSFCLKLDSDQKEEFKRATQFICDFQNEKRDLSWLGDGRTSEHILEEIKKFLGIK